MSEITRSKEEIVAVQDFLGELFEKMAELNDQGVEGMTFNDYASFSAITAVHWGAISNG